MKFNTICVLVAGLALAGCDLFAPAAGSWELEVDDAERCTVDMEIEQSGEDLVGEADIDCRIYFSINGESYYYDLEERNVDVEGEYDGGEIELEMSFFDDFLDSSMEIVIEGELEEGEFEGELILDGDEFGDISGDVSQ